MGYSDNTITQSASARFVRKSTGDHIIMSFSWFSLKVESGVGDVVKHFGASNSFATLMDRKEMTFTGSGHAPETLLSTENKWADIALNVVVGHTEFQASNFHVYRITGKAGSGEVTFYGKISISDLDTNGLLKAVETENMGAVEKISSEIQLVPSGSGKWSVTECSLDSSVAMVKEFPTYADTKMYAENLAGKSKSKKWGVSALTQPLLTVEQALKDQDSLSAESMEHSAKQVEKLKNLIKTYGGDPDSVLEAVQSKQDAAWPFNESITTKEKQPVQQPKKKPAVNLFPTRRVRMEEDE